MLATEQDAVREYTRNVGHSKPDHAWILSDYDTWERNPFYHGPAVRHPEDDVGLYDDLEEQEAIMEAAFGPVLPLCFGYPF